MNSSRTETTHSSRSGCSRLGIDTRLLDSLPDAAILTDVEGVILYWNRSRYAAVRLERPANGGAAIRRTLPENVRLWMIEEIGKRADGLDWEGSTKIIAPMVLEFGFMPV